MIVDSRRLLVYDNQVLCKIMHNMYVKMPVSPEIVNALALLHSGEWRHEKISHVKFYVVKYSIARFRKYRNVQYVCVSAQFDFESTRYTHMHFQIMLDLR